MKQIIQEYKTGELSVADVPAPVVQSGMVLVQNAYSLISAGTERSSIELARKSLLAKARSRPEDLKKIINLARRQGLKSAYKTAMARLETPVPLGYSSAGIVLEVGEGVVSIKKGDRVACAGAGYATHSEIVLVPENLCTKLPDNVPLDWASFTTLGAIAMQGIRQADIRIGECVAVIGLGLLGQLTVQILKGSGCRVIGLDLENDKVKLAKLSGADIAFSHRSSNLISHISHLTSGFGVDAVIVTAATSTNEPFLIAPEIARDRARIVLVGVAKLDFPREPYYRKELSVILSRSYGPGRYDPQYEESGIDYPIGYVRWTEKRNMEAVLQLMAEKRLNIDLLISHKFRIDDAQKAYDLILGKTKQKFLGVLFEYETVKKHEAKIIIPVSPIPRPSISKINVGFIGAGSFAQTSLLPNLKNERVQLVSVADAQSHIARYVAQKYKFQYCTSDYKEILNDKNINTVFIATRHNLHAQLIVESLKAGKHTFCEKPLCMNESELNEIIKVYNNCLEILKKQSTDASFHCFTDNPLLMLGFNRRFAPLTIKTREFLGKKLGPYLINYRINAGILPPNHWLLDPEQGGGRIVGEVCHFVDYISFIVNAKIKSVYAEALSKGNDNVLVTLKYDDGSVGSISYFDVGDKDFPKERIEIFGDNKVCVIDDFREMFFSEGGKTKRIKMAQDKGHKNEILAFFNAILKGKESQIPFKSIIESTRTTFAIKESLASGKAIALLQIATI